MATQKEWHLLLPASDPDFPWTKYLGGSLCVGTFYWGTNQFIVQRTLAAKDEMHARMGVIGAMYLKFLLPFMTVVPGLMAAKIFPAAKYPVLAKTPDLCFAMLVEKLLPSGLIGLVLAGLIAAIMSHVSGAINSCTTIASMDFYLPYFRKNASEQQTVRFGKIVGSVVVALGIFWALVMIAHSDRPIFIYIMDAYGYFAPGITTMFFLGIFWKRATHAGALAAGIATVPLSALLQNVFHMPFYNRTGIAFWVCMVIGVVVSLYTKPKTEEELTGLIWNKESLVLPKEQRHLMAGWRNPAIWWSIVMAAVLFMYARYY
jgi:solute:Na+ symporter, SSS family